MVIGLILVAIGAIALLIKVGVLTDSLWDYTWPTVLIILGLTFLWGRRRSRRSWLRWCRQWRFPTEEEEKR